MRGRWASRVPGLAMGPELQPGAGAAAGSRLQPPAPDSSPQPPASQHSSLAGSVALGWPLPPPGCPHSLTSLAWQQRPNKLRASFSSQLLPWELFFFSPPLSFSQFSVCAVHKYTPTCKQWLLLKRVSEVVFEQTDGQEDACIHTQPCLL